MKQPSDSPNSRSPLLRLLGKILPAEEPRWLYIVRRGLILLGSLLVAGALLMLLFGSLRLGTALLLLLGALLFDAGLLLGRYYNGGDPRPLEMRDPLDSGMQFAVSARRLEPLPTVIPVRDVTERQPDAEMLQRVGQRGLRRKAIWLLQKGKTVWIYLGAFCLLLQIFLAVLVENPTLWLRLAVAGAMGLCFFLAWLFDRACRRMSRY